MIQPRVKVCFKPISLWCSVPMAVLGWSQWLFILLVFILHSLQANLYNQKDQAKAFFAFCCCSCWTECLNASIREGGDSFIALQVGASHPYMLLWLERREFLLWGEHSEFLKIKREIITIVPLKLAKRMETISRRWVQEDRTLFISSQSRVKDCYTDEDVSGFSLYGII